MYLVSVDAAIFASSRQMGTGVVIRDHKGTCLVVCRERHDELAEALAMHRAISLAKDVGFENIIISSDCLSVVQRVTVGTDNRSLCGPVVRDIRKLARSFTSYTLSSCKPWFKRVCSLFG
jgi:ribonuclease HI